MLGRLARCLLSREQGQLHPVGCLNSSVAVAPRRGHRRCDRRGAGRDESPGGVLAVGDLYREPDCAGHAAAGLDRVDCLSLGIVEQLERRPARVKGNGPAVLGTPVGNLLEPEHVAVERQRLVELLHRQSDTQLRHISHSHFLTSLPAFAAPSPDRPGVYAGAWTRSHTQLTDLTTRSAAITKARLTDCSSQAPGARPADFRRPDSIRALSADSTSSPPLTRSASRVDARYSDSPQART